MSFFWIVDFKQSKDGLPRPVVIGGRAFTTGLKAQQYIDDSNLSQRAEIFELNTSNTGKATQMIKARLINRYKDLDRGLTRAIHKSEEE